MGSALLYFWKMVAGEEEETEETAEEAEEAEEVEEVVEGQTFWGDGDEVVAGAKKER